MLCSALLMISVSCCDSKCWRAGIALLIQWLSYRLDELGFNSQQG